MFIFIYLNLKNYFINILLIKTYSAINQKVNKLIGKQIIDTILLIFY